MVTTANTKTWNELSDIEQDKWINSACMLRDTNPEIKPELTIYKLAELLYNRQMKK